mmetsp:Transcript_10489/g.14702  ORF Transcript_10489/g.14702 Transcript_10489/m.14702 type:complete len:126 (-) Transcript_10489:364-741(-)|eukprot:CAMPEP_0185723736 /NCGR_PEP_ID=MMETSP1171-20130828/475_1 /TAXON_ID=374046 /ORGANISM="Helicotheca tamensis, Strain CCMP826" /LENGTH=125 /DNA_ID=CAMNT_0028391485 /DNA_START=109 /DNA_END=486 /DNA_ORIENTATION=+
MPWWGGSKDDSSSDAGTSDFSSNTDFTSDDDAGFAAASNASAMSGGGDIQQFSMALQQQMLVQQVITKLTDVAFERCITGKPGDSLSGSQAECIQASVGKWMDTNEFMMGRLAKKQQASQAGQFH